MSALGLLRISLVVGLLWLQRLRRYRVEQADNSVAWWGNSRVSNLRWRGRGC